MNETGYVSVALLCFVFLCFITYIFYMQCKEYHELCNRIADVEFELLAMERIIKHNMESEAQLYGSRLSLMSANSSLKILLPSQKVCIMDPDMDKEYFV